MNVVCQSIPGRLATYKIIAACGTTLGFLRLDVSTQKWIARTTGSATRASDLRQFFGKDDAIQWLSARKRR